MGFDNGHERIVNLGPEGRKRLSSSAKTRKRNKLGQLQSGASKTSVPTTSNLPPELTKKFEEKTANFVSQSSAADIAYTSESAEALYDLYLSIKDKDDKGSVGIKYILSLNRYLGTSVLDMLSFNGNKDIRANVAAHRNTPKDILDALSQDPEDSVRYEVAKNPNTEATVINSMLDDNDVVNAIVEGPHATTELIDSIYKRNGNEHHLTLVWIIGDSKNTSPETLDLISQSPDHFARQRVARNTHTNLDTLDTLAKDNDDNVRLEVARNRETRIETLIEMVEDKSMEVIHSAYQNIKERKLTFQNERLTPTMSKDTVFGKRDLMDRLAPKEWGEESL